MSRTGTLSPAWTFLTTAVLIATAFVFPQRASAQQISITSGSATSCSGVIEDSGGPSGEYGNNEDYTFTICPDVPGNVVYLTWFVFNLSTQGPNADYLSIYDGDNTGATGLGTYHGSELQNLIVSGTVFNTTGCLTLVFHSNGAGTGNFSCGFQCTTPCEHPIAAAVMSEPVPALICQGETVQFDGSGSYAQSGFTIDQYLWDFHDGSVDSTSGALVSHTFTTPGEHMVQLYITDNNDCESLNLVDQQVLVSTTPNFGGTSPDQTTCQGETVQLNGVVHPVTWTGIPDVNYGNGVYLPDDVGQPFQSELHFEQFDAGQTVTSVSNIQSICVDMEHSFMGDLVLQVICPNGQTTIMHQQNGSGTYIGGANDTDDDTDPHQGECWHYCWSPTATNGTFADNSTVGSTPHTVLGGNPPSQALAPGTYESVQPFSNLLGCPLNGNWTFQSTDLWGADNGFICGWEINFDPSIIPDVTQFTPSIGLADPDSSYWTGPNIGSTSADGDQITIQASSAGSFDYVYHALDNFGCAYDTTITLTVNPLVPVDAGPDQTYCSTPLQLHAVTGQSGMTYAWSPATGLSNANISNPTVTIDNTTTYTVTAYPNGHPACATSDDVTIFLDPGLDPGNDTAIVVCQSAPDFQLIDMLGGTPVSGGVWTDPSGSTANTTFHPLTDAANTFTYTVTTLAGCVGSATLDITILPLTDPTCCGIVDAGPDTLVCTLSHVLHATPVTPGLGNWVGPNGATYSNPNDPYATVTVPATGTYRFYWHENDGNLCDLWDSVFVTFTQPITIAMSTSNAVCFGYCDGTAQAAVQGGIMANGPVFRWQDAVADTTQALADSLCAGTYTLRVEDDNGCYSNTSFTIGQPELLMIDAKGSEPATCFGSCDGSAFINDHAAVLYSFDGGATYTTVPTLDPACAGVYALAIKDAIGCIGTDTLLVDQPPAVVAEFEWSPIPANVNDPTIFFHNTSQYAQTYSWDFATLGTSTAISPAFDFPFKFPGTYPVCLIAYNANNCPDTVCHNVVIDDVLQVYVPNAFTADGNGLNETWGVVYNIPDMDYFELTVFDRWGRPVFSSTDPNVHWDGTYKNGGGELLPQGVYAYKLAYRIDSTKGRREVLGHVTLLK